MRYLQSKGRVLFLCAELFPSPYAFLGKVFNDLLQLQGFSPIWVMPSMKVNRLEERDWNGSPLVLIPKMRPKNMHTLMWSYWRHLSYVYAAAHLALRQYGPFRLIQVRDDPGMAYVAWRLTKKLRVPFVYQLSHLKEEEYIIYAQRRLYGSAMNNFIQGRVGLVLRNLFLRKADLVFPISDQMKKTLLQYGVSQDRMVVLPEGVDTSVEPEVYDDAAKKIRKKLGLEGKKVVIYVGTMNRVRQLEFLLDVFKQVLYQHPDAHLLMVGDGKIPEDLIWLRSKAVELQIKESVTFTGWVPRDQIAIYIRASDIGVSPFPPNKVLINNSPIKLLEYMALEVPVVGTDIPDQRKVIEESGGGFCVPWRQKAFAKTITEILSLSEVDRRAIGHRGRIYVQKNRDFSICAEIVCEAYDKLLSEERKRCGYCLL